MRPRDSDQDPFGKPLLQDDDSPFSSSGPASSVDRTPTWSGGGRPRQPYFRRSPLLAIIVVVAAISGALITFGFLLNDDEHNKGAKFYNAGLAAQKKGDSKIAIADYSQSLQYETNKSYQADAFIQRGILYRRAHQDDKALADFNSAIDLDKTKDAAFFDRGLVETDQAKYVDALKDFDTSIQLNPKDKDAYYERTCVYLLQNDNDRARAEAKLLIGRGGELKPWAKDKLIKGLAHKADTEATASHFPVAIKAMADAIDLDPTRADLYRLRAILELRSGDLKSSATDTQRCRKLGGKTSDLEIWLHQSQAWKK